MIILELDSIGVTYGDRAVLTAASLRAPAGRVTALIGRNGTGKTSLLRAGLGLQRAMHGVIRFDGRTCDRPRLAALARAGLFFLPARAILDPRLAIGNQFVAVSRYFSGPSVDALAGDLHLDDLLDRLPTALSAGELRRAEVALACARDPICLVADEPFRGIDPRDIEVVARALRSLTARGTAVVITGHELAAIRAVADGVAWCVAGTTHEFPEASTAWSNAQLQRDFLGA